ncbi:hypothetical protein ACQCVH_24265 [Bacillus infantis]|uniref:hypothetical protein n=1 Tax=Bacillus infantis TaxID=324767 RepID=UPI003CF5B7F6
MGNNEQPRVWGTPQALFLFKKDINLRCYEWFRFLPIQMLNQRAAILGVSAAPLLINRLTNRLGLAARFEQ